MSLLIAQQTVLTRMLTFVPYLITAAEMMMA